MGAKVNLPKLVSSLDTICIFEHSIGYALSVTIGHRNSAIRLL